MGSGKGPGGANVATVLRYDEARETTHYPIFPAELFR